MSGHADPEKSDRADAEEDQSLWTELALYGAGFVLAIGLTITSFWVASSHLFWGPGVPFGLAALAIAQMGVHLVFFLHITTGRDNINNVMALAFGLLIVFLVVAGSLWIMANLNANMMPGDQLMNMQMQH